ncbi:MAG TPA: FAD-dependent monooxygenase [Planctomicrobium sp.]|nr:FAD-dependent monooxygenase [Planctomicrobium sp.]
MKVIIIGSGIAGLSTAIGLRKVGIQATVYERARELTEVGAGISLWANALRALQTLGVGETVLSRSISLENSEIRTDEGRQRLISFPASILEKQVGMTPIVAMIHRADLVEALAEFVPTETVRYGFECVGIEQNDQRVVVRFSNGHADEANAIIGADGIKSVVRTCLFGEQPPRYSGYSCWRGISPLPANIPSGYIGEWWGRGKRFGITTLSRNRAYWFAVHNAPAGQHFADGHSVVAELFRNWADPVPEIIAATPPERLIHNDIIDRVPTNTWSRGRVGLIGDAAHPTTPNLGQGGCMAIEDAVAVARALATSTDPEMAFLSFTKERFPRTAAITNESWRFGKIASMEGRLSCWLRDTMSGLVLPLIGTQSLCKHSAFDIGPLPAP